VLGLKGQPVWHAVIRQREAVPRYDLEHASRREHIAHMLAALPGLSLLGNWNRGLDCERLVADARAMARDHAAHEEALARAAWAARAP
jgi:oxygen-dependent protoporphyrinogen oxidase